ncbi:MAG: cytochrome b N-terminal domain-containing protein [Planctomycetes bacterium]|nr:cytochrome b N-terminal domain-containing protein [Planctomycetota bacterium]
MAIEPTKPTQPIETDNSHRQDADQEVPSGALHQLWKNLLSTPWKFRESAVRHGRPTSDRAASQAVFSNVFLHILPTRIHRHALRVRSTFGLGVITLVLFFLLVATGVALMVYYKPSTDQAYDSMKEIQYIVPTGRFMRNIHRWAAHGMVLFVILHMARAFYTSAYKGTRQFNWVIGMILFVLTLMLSFTGYLLPWDQLAYWAVTIGSQIAESPRELTDALGITSWFDIGGLFKRLMLGANQVGEEALIRFYVLHIVVLPILLCIFLAVHFWRIRKDGGIVRPQSADEPSSESDAPNHGRTAETAPTRTYGLMAVVRGRTPAVDRSMANTLPTWPNAIYAIAALSMLTFAVMLCLGHSFDAPLKEHANPAVPENPAKAPWYFLGLQELVSYSAFMGGVGIPTIVVLGLMLVPYLDREKEDVGVWFSGPKGRRICLLSALLTTVVVVGILAFTVNFGWLRSWYPDIPQIVITLVNPGTVLLVIFMTWSFAVTKRMNSTRMGAIAIFTCFLIAFTILTYFATVHRGPNWEFYWSQGDWPVH